MGLKLPPLNALRAFETAARSGSYVAAASELGVSAAAVSQQVKNLEQFLGKQLFRRYNNRIVLTDAGQTIFSGASNALQSISAFTDLVVSGRARSRLVISCLTSVSERFLTPHLGAFAARRPGFRFELRIEEDVVDFARHEIDLRLAYGAGHYPDLTTIRLARDMVLPMASPAYLARNPRAASVGLEHVADDDLIHTNWGPSFVSHPSWKGWFSGLGDRVPDDSRGFRVAQSSLALDCAREGIGVALGQKLLAADDLASGRLVALSERASALGHDYCLVHPPAKARKAGLAELVDFLIGRVSAVID